MKIEMIKVEEIKIKINKKIYIKKYRIKMRNKRKK